ncbi:hypothetical protein ACIQXV_08025 [Neobacillus sp. NPDC097160]
MVKQRNEGVKANRLIRQVIYTRFFREVVDKNKKWSIKVQSG